MVTGSLPITVQSRVTVTPPMDTVTVPTEAMSMSPATAMAQPTVTAVAHVAGKSFSLGQLF